MAEVKNAFLDRAFRSRFSVALLSSLADFATEIHFGREKAERVNACNNRHTLIIEYGCYPASQIAAGNMGEFKA